MKKAIYHIIFLLTISLIACNDRDADPVIEPGGEKPDSPNKEITFTMKVPSQNTTLSSYASASDQENTIDRIDILVFNVNGTEETYAYQQTVTNITNAGSSDKKQFTVELEKNDTPQRFVLLANCGDEVEVLGDIAPTGIKDKILSRLQHCNFSEWPAGKAIPMWGETQAVPITDSSSELNVTMIRMKARIDVSSIITTEVFEMTDIYVYHHHLIGHIVPDASKWNSSSEAVTGVTIPETAWRSTTPFHYEVSSNPYINSMYLYEADAVSDIDSATCLVIGGYYMEEKAKTYYRLDFTDSSGDLINLRRNHLYNTTITAINAKGEDDKEKALKSKNVSLTVDIEDWNEYDIPEGKRDGIYRIIISENDLVIPAGAAEYTVDVWANHPDGWSAEVEIHAASWITISSPSPAQGNSGVNTPLKFRVNPYTGNTSRKGEIIIKAGRLQLYIIVTQFAD